MFPSLRGVLMSDILWFVLGWILGLFTAPILEPVSRWLGTGWHLLTRRKTLDEHDRITYAIDKAWTIKKIRKFFKISGSS